MYLYTSKKESTTRQMSMQCKKIINNVTSVLTGSKNYKCSSGDFTSGNFDYTILTNYKICARW